MDPADQLRTNDADFAANHDPEQLLRRAAELFRAGKIRSGAELAIRAGDSAAAARRPDLLAAAALIVSGVQEPMLDVAIETMCRAALAAVDPGDVTTRARLHGQLAVALYHRGRMEEAGANAEQALALAGEGGDPTATAAAIHARQMVGQGGFRPAELLELGDRMLQLASGPDSQTRALLAHVWRIEGYMQLADPRKAAEEVDSLDVLAASCGEPLIAWHALRARAGVLQAVGQFGEAERFAHLARERVSAAEVPFALSQYYAQRVMIALDRGLAPPEFEVIRRLAPGGLALIGASVGYLELVCGDRAAARASFEATRARLADARRDETWLGTIAPVLVLALAFEEIELAEVLVSELAPFDGLVVGGAIGVLGPVGYFCGLVESHAGRLDNAIAYFERAAALCARGDLGPSLARVRVALADALVRRSGAGDRDRAATLVSIAAADARRLGMMQVHARATELEKALSTSPGLSPRERGVAREVAAGRSNREIAATLVVSERTVETHVQNILTKLGFHSRAQIAAWAVRTGLLDRST